MNILLIEDEPFAAKSLQIALQKLEPAAQIEGPVSSVKEARKRLSGTHLPDLILCDIQLADGIAFDIFKEDIPPIPVISPRLLMSLPCVPSN
jgi:two-component system response regulator LytT